MYLKAAFWNLYNLALLGGALTASTATGEYALGAVALGAEALWLAFGSRARPFRRSVDRKRRERENKKERERVARSMHALPEKEWARAKALDDLRADIARDMKQNPSFAYLLVQPEVDKLEQLHASFVALAQGCVKAEKHLKQADERELIRQIDREKGVQTSAEDSSVRELAAKNVEVLVKRLDSLRDIQGFLRRARGQMTLIENSVRLLRDQVLTMQRPATLDEQLDDLLNGVAAVKSALREDDAFAPGVPLETRVRAR